MRSKNFVQTFWVQLQSKTFVQTFWMQSTTVVQKFGCEARLLFNHCGVKWDFCSTFVVHSKTFVQTCCNWVQSKTFIIQTFWMQRKTFVQIFWVLQDFCSSILGAKQDFCPNIKFCIQSKAFVQKFWV